MSPHFLSDEDNRLSSKAQATAGKRGSIDWTRALYVSASESARHVLRRMMNVNAICVKVERSQARGASIGGRSFSAKKFTSVGASSLWTIARR
jgi:hypothetical protein